MPRRKGIKEEDVDTSHVSLRMRKDLLKMVDDLFWKHRTDRTVEVTKACEFYVTAIICPKCGTLNDRKSNYCSVCLEPLSEIAKEKKRIFDLLDTIITDDTRYQKVLGFVQDLATSLK